MAPTWCSVNMIEAVVGLTVVALVATVLGAGWAALLHRVAPPGWIGFLFFSWCAAIVLSSAVWSWLYPTRFGVGWAIGCTLVVALIGYGLAWWRGSFGNLQGGSRSLAGLAAAAVVVLLALVPTYSSWTHVSMGIRIGPDGGGYAIAARSISQGVTQPVLEKDLEAQEGVHTFAAAMTKRVDTTQSVSTQVASEFLLGADRLGFPGVVGSVLYLDGPGQLWTILTLLAAFGLLTACIGAWSIVRVLTRGPWPALFATIVLGLSPALLNAWHEGALAEIWVLPACLLFARPLVALGQEDRVAGAVSVGLGCALILVAYNDAMLIYAVLFALCMLLSVPLLRHRWWSTWWPLMAGAAAGGLLITPSSSAFLSTLRRSLNENTQAGWWQPRWLDLAEAFGLHNAFTNGVPVPTTRSAGENVSQVIEDGVVVAFLGALLWRRWREPAVVLLTAVVTAAAGVYVKTRYLDHLSNYQYFKTVALLVPAGALAVSVLLGRSFAPRTAPAATARARHSRPPHPSVVSRGVVFGLSAVIAVMVVVAAVSYTTTYRSQGTRVPSAFGSLPASQAPSVFDRFNIVAPTGDIPPRTAQARILSFDLAAEVPLNWIGRYAGVPTTRLDGRLDNPVALLVFEEDCPRFSCLNGIPRSRIPFAGGGLALVELDSSTRSLAALPETAWADWAAARFKALGGGQLVGDVPSG